LKEKYISEKKDDSIFDEDLHFEHLLLANIPVGQNTHVESNPVKVVMDDQLYGLVGI
jgi:hypothetical protein